jgi:hypothetical protein
MKRNMRNLLLCITALAALGGLGGVKLTEDAPLTNTPKPGDIVGTLSPSKDIDEVTAAVRDTGKVFKPQAFDKITGRYEFRNLPGGANYDICIKLKDGRSVEGIDLAFVDERLLHLAELRRKDLGLPAERQHTFVQEDVDSLLKYAADLKDNDFMDRSRVLYVAGHGRRATMLVELMRTREFYAQAHDAAGVQVIWRVELWYFECQFGGWERVANQERVLHRERIPSGKWQKISVEYLPELSVHLAGDGKLQMLDFTVPDKADPTRGRPAGTEPNIKAEPHILGMAATTKPTTQPATQP